MLIFNKVQRNLATGYIALLSFFPGGSIRCELRRAWCICDPLFGRIGGQRWYHSKEQWRFPTGSPLCLLRYLWPFGCNLLSNVSDADVNRWWVVGHFRPKFGDEGIDRCKPNFNTIWERHGAAERKRNIFSRLSTMHESDRPDHGTVTSIAIGEITHQRCRLKIFVQSFLIVEAVLLW